MSLQRPGLHGFRFGKAEPPFRARERAGPGIG